MKSIELLAQEAYYAWLGPNAAAYAYSRLATSERARWIAVAQKLRAELLEVH